MIWFIILIPFSSDIFKIEKQFKLWKLFRFIHFIVFFRHLRYIFSMILLLLNKIKVMHTFLLQIFIVVDEISYILFQGRKKVKAYFVERRNCLVTFVLDMISDIVILTFLSIFFCDKAYYVLPLSSFLKLLLLLTQNFYDLFENFLKNIYTNLIWICIM